MAAPELRLNVTLDLASFRSQLGKLAQTAAAYYYPVNLIIDKKNFEAQLKALGKIKPVININDDQLIAARTRIGTLNKSLATLRRATATPIEIKVKYVEQGKPSTGTISKSGTFRQRLTGLDTEPIKQLYAAAGKAGIVQFDAEIAKNKGKIITALNQAGESSVTGLLNGLKSKDSAVKTAAKSLGDILIAALKLSLQIQSPSKKMEAIGEDAGDGFNKGLKESLNEAKNSAVTEMRELVAALKSEAAKIQNISVAPSSLRGTPRRGAGFRALPEGASQAGAGVEFSEMMRRFRGEIAALTTQPQKYEQLLNALPDRRITTDLADVASRRSRAAEMPSFMPIQRQLGPGELEKQIISDLAQYIKSIRIPNPWVGPTGDYQKFIGNISRTTKQLTSQALLPLPKDVKLLPPGSSSTFQQTAAARTQIAYQRSAARSATVLGGPSGPVGGGGGGGGGLPPSGGGGLPPGGGGGGAPPVPPSGGGRGGGFFAGMQFNVPKLPGAGIVQGLGTEFAFAAKQVLLFGTAYKALAFLTDFPSQVGTAVGQLQSFRNTLNAVSPSAQEAAQSSQFILDVVDKYNVPLQSARDGFTRLYASMQPAGFGGNEIRDLFLGISQAAATFGMSADKVDRVNYAFAQMASKGQVMSEELKGQLGDVLPGSMALFAEAAGFKGPQAITKFSKALEDGVYKGGAMKTLLTNVGIVMRKEFGPGAEGAAKTFQGSINRMQNSLKLFYETFEPVAVGFLNAVVTPMTSGIKTLTDGFNAFFTGAATKTSGGFAIAQELKDLKPSFDGILSNLKELIPSFQVLGKVILGVAKTLTVIAGNPIVGFLLKIYTNMLLVNGVFTLLGGRVLLGLISNLGAAIAKFIALNFAVASLQRTSVVANSTLAGTRLQMGLLSRGATGALGPIGLLTKALIGLARFSIILVGIEIVISGLAELDRLNKSLDKIAGFSSKEYTAEVKGLSKEDVNSRIIVNRRAQLSATKELKQFEGGLGKAKGLVTGRDEELRNRMVVLQTQGLILESAKNNKSQAQLDKERTEKELAKIKLEGGDDGKAAKKEAERQAKLQDKLANRRDQLELEAANRRAALDQTSFDSRLRMSEAEYDHKRALQDTYFEREMSGLDSIEARQKKFQQDLKAIEDRRIDSIRKAELDAVKAVQDLRTASIKATAVTGGTPGGAYLQGNIGPTSTGPHFDVKKQGGGFFPRNYLDPYVAVNGAPLSTGTTVRGGTFAAHQARGSHGWDYAFGAGRHAATLKGGAEWMGGVPTAHGEKRKFKIPTGEIFSFLHGGSEGINARPINAATRPGAFAMGRREDKAKGQLAVEQEDAQNKALEKLETIRRANNLALEQTITLVKQNIDSIFPVKEQQLENDLLELRNKLELKGTSKEIVDMEVQKAKATKEYTHALEKLNGELDTNKRNLKALEGKSIKTETDKIEIGRLKELIAGLNREIAKTPELQKRFDEALAKGVDITKRQKEIEKVKALVGDFVSDTSSKYKGFLKAVISGEDAADALQKFQEGLTDKVLTIFLDFAMAPVEDMMKKSLEGLFLPKTDTSKVQANVAVDANTTATTANTLAIEALTAAKGAGIVPGATPGAAPGQGGVPIEVIPFGSQSTLPAFDFSATDSLFGGLQDQIKASLDSVSLSFADAAFNLNTSAEPWKQALITDIPFALSSSNEQIATQGTTFSEGLTNVVGGIGAAAAGIAGIAAGISQIGKGGTSNVLGGIGSILMGAGGAIGGFGKIFGFADGGIPPMNKPSLVGERGPELFVPHSMGTIVPAGPTAGIREAMANGNGQSNASPVLNMSFESSTINGVEYVSRDQLEAAMMETRRQASRDGAKRGMTMTLDRLQQSPSTRSRIGLG